MHGSEGYDGQSQCAQGQAGVGQGTRYGQHAYPDISLDQVKHRGVLTDLLGV